MHNLLLEIIANKREEVELIEDYSENFITEFVALRNNCTANIFKNSLRKDHLAIIGEIKRKSPSKGNLAIITDPVQLSQQYINGGVEAISILTDEKYFSGSLTDLKNIRKNVLAPLLRKDFILDKKQIIEAALNGADAILLIVSVLQDKIKDLYDFSKKLNVDALIEVHTKEELNLALAMGAKMIGINNRNLNTFEVDLNTSLKLIQYIPDHVISVAESGIFTAEDAQKLRRAGFDAILVGESLVRHPNPTLYIQQMKGVA